MNLPIRFASANQQVLMLMSVLLSVLIDASEAGHWLVAR